MFKKPSILCSCSSFLSLHPSSVPPPNPSTSSPWQGRSPFQQCRRYAHVHSSGPIPHEGDLSWPTNPIFSPYDLLKQERSAPYSKRRFYEFAKVYHPDRPCDAHPSCGDIPHSVKAHRYRILVAAHEILSDSVKREAFDKFGDGWYQRAELFGTNRHGWNVSTGPDGEKDESVFRNGTWEDWERWRQRNEGYYYDSAYSGAGRQASSVSHGMFASFLVLLSLFAGAGQAVTIGGFSSIVEERVKDADERWNKLLDGRRLQTTTQMNSRDARVQHFLMKRDPSGHGLREEEEETYRQVLGPRRTAALDDMDTSAEEKPLKKKTQRAG
ncbi:hypothetical protein AJ80_05257 [Polytolypa hystricis UAMH7299]|uniref:J domain-containing protein n=1 Tax=Polytolypa hystricis (strain UAMH7299) TaxID=1447883 RepID=A0A2B7XWT1_POLH7|nr:hypothetical protein AJ80_05257 [Polytolypa hystricis UAMH7299]